jgi:ArsR family transcriptional regulator
MKKAAGSTNAVFRAFADQTRLRLLNLLLERELCVCELCEVLRLAQPKASRHLAYLRRADLVTVRQAGKWKHYALARRRTGLRRKLLDCMDSCRREIGILRDDLTRLKKVSRSGVGNGNRTARFGSQRC